MLSEVLTPIPRSGKKMIIMTNTSKESNDPIAWLSDICVLNAEMAVE